MIEIVPATLDHARAIELRPGDAMEIAALGLSTVEAFEVSAASALWTHAYLIDGEVAALVGLSAPSLLGEVGVPWLLTGRPVDRHRKDFLRETARGVNEMRAHYHTLTNLVHADYGQALRWMAWLGFALGPPQPHGPYGAPFCPAVMRTP